MRRSLLEDDEAMSTRFGAMDSASQVAALMAAASAGFTAVASSLIVIAPAAVNAVN
jgi:hypothetical protein